MKNSDIKIRFSGNEAETWLPHCFNHILEWEWYTDVPTKTLFIHLIITANHSDNKYRGMVIKRGEKWTSVNTLSIETGLSIKQVRTALKKLENTGEISAKGANKGTIVSICKYDTYQFNNQTEGQTKGKQGASKGQGEGKQRATNNNEKNENNEELEEYSFSVPEKQNPKSGKENSIENQTLSDSTVAGAAPSTRPVKRSVKKQLDPNAEYHSHPKMNAAIQEFIKHRSEIKKPLTEIGLNRMLSGFKGFTIKECITAIDTAIIGGYQGVFVKSERVSSSRKDDSAGPNLPDEIDYSSSIINLDQ